MKKYILIHLSFLVLLASCVVGQNGGVAPSTTTTTSSSSTCAGASVGGYCWYLGTSNQSCTTVCTSHGGYDSATESYAGMAGSTAQCKAVLVALGYPANLTVNDINTCILVGISGNGCSHDGVTGIRCTDGAASAAAANAGQLRACACFN